MAGRTERRRRTHVDDAACGDPSEVRPLRGLTRGRQSHKYSMLDDTRSAPVAPLEGLSEMHTRLVDDPCAEAKAEEDDGPAAMGALEEHLREQRARQRDHVERPVAEALPMKERPVADALPQKEGR